MLISIVSVGACIAGCTFLGPQLVRLVRTRDTAGISATMAALGALSCMAWTFYGFAVEAWPLVVTGGLEAAEYLAFCVLLQRAHHPFRRAVVMTAVGTAGMLLAMTLAEVIGQDMWSGLGAALNVAVVAQYFPAVLEANRAPATTGIALGTWVIVGMNGTLWGLYGALIGDLALVEYGLALWAATAGVAIAVLRTRWPAGSLLTSRTLSVAGATERTQPAAPDQSEAA